MNIGKCLGFICGVLFVALSLGGCADQGKASTPFTIINNTKEPVDVECEGQVIVPSLAQGKSFTFNIAAFYVGCDVTLVAKGHTEDGEHLGVATHNVKFVSGYRYGPYNSGFYGYYREPAHSGIWVINYLDPPHEVKKTGRGW